MSLSIYSSNRDDGKIIISDCALSLGSTGQRSKIDY